MYRELRKARWNDIKQLSEIIERSSCMASVQGRKLDGHFYGEAGDAKRRLSESGMNADQFMNVIDSALMTQLLHMEARIASSMGKGFYTIGPCGEELLAAASLHLKSTDSVALHYRHTANSISRQLSAGRDPKDIMLDRARAYTCSSLDPVTGGRHCSIGGGPNEFLVTSTLASQCPPAVGRALGIPLANSLNIASKQFPKDAVSYVSVGDGSTNNAHFLSAVNLAKYAAFKKTKVPVVFGVSDNGLCISLKGGGYVNHLVNSLGIETFSCDGRNIYDVYRASQKATTYTRRYHKPSAILYSHLPRRFGHAATDRQFAYLTEEEIQQQQGLDPLSWALAEAVNAGIMGYEEVEAKLVGMEEGILEAFEKASEEPKLASREELCISNAAPLAPAPASASVFLAGASTEDKKAKERVVMRKNMTALYGELLEGSPADASAGEEGARTALYVGEDVEHGGYYLVSEGLKKAHPSKVMDFPPDETTLVGAGQGLAQCGFVPIVELPYAKYLDCGADSFQESIITHWLSNGTQPNGMIYRLQGFDKGVFGGNFHTHNALPFLYSPGLDVICHSNGANYVAAMRYAFRQAKAGRVVMSVDCTDLLNKRHLNEKEKDGYFLSSYPHRGSEADASGEFSFDDVVIHAYSSSDADSVSGWSSARGAHVLDLSSSSTHTHGAADLVIVTYGNGVPTALKAAKAMMGSASPAYTNIAVVEAPYLSAPAGDLRRYLQSHAHAAPTAPVVFADICKAAMAPLASISTQLHSEGSLEGRKWALTAAADTYNPLGNLVTFLSEEDIQGAAGRLH